jgi:hypothetical protein
MKTAFLFTFLALLNYLTLGQQIQKIVIPKGIVYHYCDSATYEKAKGIVKEELSETLSYSLVDKIMFVGPALWKRFRKLKSLKNIQGGNTTLVVDNKNLSAKLTQELDDSKKVWDEFRQEINGTEFALRKANPEE